jgi:hypothetical protein
MSISLDRHSSEDRTKQSVLLACSFIQIPQSTVRDVLHKRLRIRTCKIQMILALKLSDKVAHINFTVGMLERNDSPLYFFCQVCFPDMATFYVNGVVIRYNCRFWGSQIPHVTWVGERQPQSECVSQFNAWQVDWTVFLFGKDCDRTFILGHAGTVCNVPVTTSKYPPKRWGATTFLPPCLDGW